MKKNLFLVLFILSNLAFSQDKEYDVYVEYRYVGGIDPYNGNVSIGVGNIIEFNEFFQSPSTPPSAFTRGDILANTTTVNTLPWNASLDFGLYSSSDNGMVSLGINGKSDFHISGQGFSWSGRILLLEKIKINAPEGRRCFKDKITVQASNGHPTEAYTWLYSAKGYDEQELVSSSSSINVSLEDLYPDPNDQLNLIDEVVTFRIYNRLNDYFSDVVTYVWSDCSIELRDDDYIQYTNPTCFKDDDNESDGKSNGTVTLNFKNNVDEVGGWEMRYFIFQGKPEDLNIDPMDSTPPQVYGGVRFSPEGPDNPNGAGYLTYNEVDGSYSGTYIGLEGINSDINPPPDKLNQQEYFVVYQEVKYEDGVATVKSGEIVPSFTIHQPTQVTLNTSDSNFYTPASCGNPAIFNFNNTAIGGDNLDSGGSYSYQYSRDNGASWEFVDISNNILEIEPIENDSQTITVRGVYNVNGSICEGEEYQFKVAPIVAPVTFIDQSAGKTSTAEASDGSAQVDFTISTPSYSHYLTRYNINTSTFDSISAPSNQVIIPGGHRISYSNLSVGTYRVIVTDDNNCLQESSDLVVGPTPIPILGTPTVTQMGCEGSYASISIPITDFNDKYRYQWIINGVASAIQTGSNPTLVENSITTPGLYILKVSNGRVSDADFNNDAYISSTMVEIDNPTTVTITNAIPNTTQCEDSNDGSITLSVTGGISYEYSLDFFPNENDWIPLTDNTITNLTPGRYQLTIRNQDGCETETLEDIIIEAAPLLELTATKINPITNGGNEGTITLNITGGSPFPEPSAAYNISWEKDGVSFADSDPSTPNFINELGAGEYSATVTDANGCDKTISITITEPGPLTILSFNGTASCSELDNGTLTATAQGTGQLIFNWILNDVSPTGTLLASTPTMDGTASLKGLSPGSYSLTIVEVDSGNEVNSDQDVIIAEAPPITATIAIAKSSCGIPNSGAISISNVSGGTPFPSGPEYKYHINDGFNNYQSDPEFINLPPRTYIVTIRDASGCEYSETVEITQAVAPVLDQTNTIITNPTAVGEADGAITLAFIGDASDYSYEWTGTGIDGVTSKDVTGLVAGDYQVTVSAPGDCILVTSFSIVDPVESEALVATISQTVLLKCNGDDFAEITATVKDGTAPYSYEWFQIQNGDNVALPEDTRIITDLSAGTYFLQVTDTNNNTVKTTPIAITQPDVLALQLNEITDVACNGGATGTIAISVSGGTSFEYSLMLNPNENDWIPLTDNTITNLTPGRYQLTIRNQDGCETETLEDIIIEAAPLLELTATKINPITNGGNEGTITLNITGGSPFPEPSAAYNISWEKDGVSFADSDPSTPNFINELGAGEYSATVTDANGCDKTISITITEPGPLTILSFNGTASCSELDNGTLTATAQGTGQLIFNWILNDVSPTGTLLASTPTMDGTASLKGLSPGSYSLTIVEVDSGNEVNSDQDVIIAEAPPITATIAIAKSSCGIPNSGAISISNVSGGTPFPSGPEYKYHINDGFNNYQSDPEFINLPPRTYIVTIRDASGCEYSETVEITQAVAPVLDQTNTIITNPTAVGEADGTITLAFISDASDYSYEWIGTGINGVTSKDVTGLVAGDYQVTVSAPGDCFLVTSFSIVDPVESGALVATINQTVLLECNGDDFAEITANVQDGTAPYSYTWFQIVNGNDIALPEDTGIIEGLSAGTYFLQVTDANNSTINSSPLTITQPDTLTIHVDEVKDILCSGEATGAINVSVAGGTSPYSYIWSNGEIDQNLSNIGAGEYTLEVMDANACFTEITVTVNNAPNSIQITNVSITNVSDYMGNDGSITLDIAGGLTPYNINWTRLSDNTNLGNQESISNLSSDTYQVSVIDANGCSIIENYEVSQPDIVDETIVQPSCSGDSNGSISVLVNLGNGNFTYSWNTGATTNAINNLTAGSYTVTISGLGNGPLTRTYVIEDPLPLEVDLGETRVLCGGQELVLDANVEDVTASYSWTSDTGFTSTLPSITLTEGGTYTVTITSQNGCSATGSVLVEVSEEEISAEFAMSSQVFTGESLMVIDLSFPFPESLEWVIPDGASIVRTTTDEAELIFNEAGEYEVGIIIKIGDCSAQRFKKVLVVANENNDVVDVKNDPNKQLEDFIIYPNPTNGKFTADITLSERGNISIKVFNFANNALMASAKERGSTSYSVPFDISGLPAGVYAVVLETPFGNSLRKVILK